MCLRSAKTDARRSPPPFAAPLAVALARHPDFPCAGPGVHRGLLRHQPQPELSPGRPASAEGRSHPPPGRREPRQWRLDPIAPQA
ncbi:hypothetical protein G6F65_023063 [Rhizopus arrhizus]|nr:hypothetical protein G6F65_023063 [Rhizopus arrhizus]